MRRKKRTKSIDDVSVTKLLDEFVDLDVGLCKEYCDTENMMKMKVNERK